MISWNEFDKIMMEADWLNSKNKLSQKFKDELKRCRCWRGNAPYCSWDFFTYSLTEQQIRALVASSKDMRS